jgi:hypothetical protein
MSAAPPNALREPREPREPQLKSMRAGEIIFGEDENKDAPHLVGLGSGSPGSRPITAAVQVLDEAAVLRVTLCAADGFIDWSAKQAPPEAFLVRLAAAKPVLVQLLDGSLCRHCFERMDWRSGNSLAFGDGTAAHLTCADQLEVARLLAAGRRAVSSPDALADPAEVMLHGGPLP